MTRWIDPRPVRVPAAFAALELPTLIAETLVRRGVTDLAAARVFLNPELQPRASFAGIEAAAEIISRHIGTTARDPVRTATRKNLICVWGDFDVDGQTATSVLVQTLLALGADVTYYIPIRGKESHGVHIQSLKPIIDNGARLIITCDTGITAYEAIDYARARDVRVVVTDHHDPGEQLPGADAIVNPKLLEPEHPLATLAGAGVAYKLAEALLARGHSPPLSSHALLDLVALGLIADVALLKGETRALVQRGIQVLRNTGRIGLQAIAELSGTPLESVTEETIGFSIAPRLNALGRLGNANPAVELLTTDDPSRARVLATMVEGLNTQRRLLTKAVYEAAETTLRENPELLREPAIVLAHPGWPGGVVGIVANRLVERYHKPAILLNQSEDGILRGSARSVEGLHITQAIAAQKEILHSFGGHPMAAGLALDAHRLPEFRRGLARAIENQLGKATRAEPELQIDCWLRLDEINLRLAESLDLLAPFGPGNPALTLATRRVRLKSAAAIGKAREHLRLNVEDESGTVTSLLWWSGAGEQLPEEGSKFDIAYSLRASTYRGEKQVTVQFEDLRIVQEVPPELKPVEHEVVDGRLESAAWLAKITEQAPGVQIWAEGPHRKFGRTRLELVQADDLAIYTAPPSPAELQNALAIVRPRRVFVIGAPPAQDGSGNTEDTLNRLAGLCKYAINQRGGEVTIRELAAAMAARENVIEIGLQWLAAGGHLTVEVADGQVSLSAEKSEPNQYLQAELYVALTGILRETAAYRQYFATASDLRQLIEKTSPR